MTSGAATAGGHSAGDANVKGGAVLSPTEEKESGGKVLPAPVRSSLSIAETAAGMEGEGEAKTTVEAADGGMGDS